MTVFELNDGNFSKEVLQSPTPVLVDFWAPWCGPCKIMGPVIDDMAQGWSSKPLKIAKLNVDESNAVAGQYKVMSIPTFLLFRDGNVVGQWRGVVGKKELEQAVKALL